MYVPTIQVGAWLTSYRGVSRKLTSAPRVGIEPTYDRMLAHAHTRGENVDVGIHLPTPTYVRLTSSRP